MCCPARRGRRGQYTAGGARFVGCNLDVGAPLVISVQRARKRASTRPPPSRLSPASRCSERSTSGPGRVGSARNAPDTCVRVSNRWGGVHDGTASACCVPGFAQLGQTRAGGHLRRPGDSFACPRPHETPTSLPPSNPNEARPCGRKPRQKSMRQKGRHFDRTPPVSELIDWRVGDRPTGDGRSRR